MSQLTKCPLCKGKIQETIKPFVYDSDTKTHIIPNIKHYVCMSCGERFLDEEASKKIDEYKED